MKFKFEKKYLIIKFSFKELFFMFLRKGEFRFDKYTVYKFQNSIMNVLYEMGEKYGDAKEHGPIKVEDLLEENKEASDQ